MGVSIVNELDVDDLVARSIREDLGAGDVTSEAVVAADARARGA